MSVVPISGSCPWFLFWKTTPPCRPRCARTLAHAGFTAHHAVTVDEALAILRREHVDAVSLDVKVPDPKGLERSGLSLLTTLRAMPGYAKVPALIFTGMPLSLRARGRWRAS